MPRIRRMNYRYLVKLKERLESMGLCFDDLPKELMYLTWEDHKTYLTKFWGLDYCVLCKLPIPEEQKAPDRRNLCAEHAERFSRGRYNMELYNPRLTEDMVDDFHARMRKSEMLEVMTQRMRHVGVSNGEAPTQESAPTPAPEPEPNLYSRMFGKDPQKDQPKD